MRTDSTFKPLAVLGVAAGSVIVGGYLVLRGQAAAREHYLTGRYERAVATLATQIGAAVDSHLSAFAQAVRGAERERRLSNGIETMHAHLARSLPGNVFQLESPDQVPCPLTYARQRFRAGFCAGSKGVLQTESLGKARAGRVQAVHSAPTLHVCGEPYLDGTSDGPICARADIGAVFERSVSGTSLDEVDVVLLDETGYATFARGPRGPRLLRWPPSAERAARGGNGPNPSPTPGAPASDAWPTFRSVQAAARSIAVGVDGRDEWLLTQPIRISLSPPGEVLRILANGDAKGRRSGAATAESEALRTWVLAALVPVDALRRESRTVSAWVFAMTALLLLFGLLLPPLLKIFTLGPRDRLRPLDVQLVAASLLTLSGLSVIAVLTVGTYATLRAEGDRVLEDRAEKIGRAFRTKLLHAHEELEAFLEARTAAATFVGSTPKEFPSEFLECSEVRDTSQCRALARTCALHPQLCMRNTGRNLSIAATTPLAAHFKKPAELDLVVIADANGDQIEKWSAHDSVTEQINMRSFRTFRDVMPLPGEDRRLTLLDAQEFAFNVQTSPNTASVRALVSIPWKQHGFDRAAIGVLDDLALQEAVSLARVADVRTPQRGDDEFAIIGTGGQVVLHSYPQRRIYENFTSECANCGDVTSALRARTRTPHVFDIEYHGRPRRAALQRLEQTEYWTLVLRDKELLRTAAFETFTLSLAAFLLASIAIVAVASTFVGFRDRASSVWIWPERAHPASYMGPLVSFVVLILLSTRALGSLHTTPALIATVAIAMIAVCGTFLGSRRGNGLQTGIALVVLAGAVACLIGTPGSSDERLTWLVVVAIALALATARVPTTFRLPRRTVEPLFVAVNLLLLVLTAVLPASAAFRDAFSHEISRYKELTDDRHLSAGGAQDPPVRSDASTASRGATSSMPGWLDGGWTLVRARADATITWARDALTTRPAERRPRWPRLSEAMALWMPYVNEEAIELRRARPRAVASLAETLPAFGGLTLLGLLTAACLTAWFLVRALVRRIFGTHVNDDVPAVRDTPQDALGELWLDPSIDEIRLAALRNPSAVLVDLHQHATVEDLLHKAGWAASARSIVVLHLEHRIDEPDWNRAKLELLEAILFTGPEKDRVLVLSEIDMLRYMTERLRSPGDPANAENYLSQAELDRWSVVLDRLAKRGSTTRDESPPLRAELQDVVRDECRWTSRLHGIAREILASPIDGRVEVEDLHRDLGDRAAAHYRMLWSACTDEERLVLLHLARDGFVSPRSWWHVRHLLARRLLRWTPALRPMNESFRRFVATVEDERVISRWERAGGLSSWRKVQVGMVVAFVVVGFVLYATRPDHLTGMLGFITAIGGGTATLVQLMGFLRTRVEASTEA